MKDSSLVTPPLPLLVSAETFDAFGWCKSTYLTWRCPTDSIALNDFADQLPLGLAFVLHSAFDPLPTEYAWLHLGKTSAHTLGLSDDRCLAPYALDDATDLFFEHRTPPADVLWIAADNLNALYWSLHDWSHFHNHGPFTDRPSTELQCDLAALSWLWLNRDTIGLPTPTWESYRAAALDNHLSLRASCPGHRCPEPVLLRDSDSLINLAESLQPSMPR